MVRRAAWVSVAFVMCACGPSGESRVATNTQQVESHAYRGEDCHAVWKRPKDASGSELPYETPGVDGAAWAKGERVHDGPIEKQVLDVICFDALEHEDTFARWVRVDDRRFDPNAIALLVDECVESGKCTSDEMIAGPMAWLAHGLELTRLSAASKKLEISQNARDAFVDRTLLDVKALDAFIAKLTPAQRAYAVDLPKAVFDARAASFKANADEYSTLDRAIERLAGSTAALLTIRSDAAARCGDARKCSSELLYREASRWLVRGYREAKMPLEARAAELALGPIHARRRTAAADVWAAQSAYRKVHPDVKEPLPVTEEEAAPPDDTTVDVVRGEVASVANAHGASKITLKDPAPAKVCEDGTEIEGFDGPLEQTRVLYKSVCRDVPPGAKVAPFTVAALDATAIKPSMTIVAAVSKDADRRGIVARVMMSDRILQLGPDKFTAATGDPLKSQL